MPIAYEPPQVPSTVARQGVKHHQKCPLHYIWMSLTSAPQGDSDLPGDGTLLSCGAE